MKMNYPILYGGAAKKDSASLAFPNISGISAFPTLLIIDKNNNIRYVHTGFNGPATGLYESFKDEFAELLSELRN